MKDQPVRIAFFAAAIASLAPMTAASACVFWEEVADTRAPETSQEMPVSAEAASAAGAAAGEEPSVAFRQTAPADADDARTYDDPDAALLAADLDYLAREARDAIERGEETSTWRTLAFSDAFAAGHYDEARALLLSDSENETSAFADLLEPFLLAAEGNVDQAVSRVSLSADVVPAPLPDVARALLFEAAGRFDEASAIYGQIESQLDLTPPSGGEPTSMEELQRALNANRISHAMYRSALVQHRLGHTAEARRLYNIVSDFAPNSADVMANVLRLDAGQPPLEPPLDMTRATGRWMLFLSEYLTQADMLRRILSGMPPGEGLASPSGMLFLQIGLALEPDADDWRLYAAGALTEAGGLDGAERIIDATPVSSVFAPDADLVRAQIAIERNDDAAANAAASRALSQADGRWAVIASAGDVYRTIGENEEAIRAFTRALEMVSDAEDRARILGWRAFAYRYSGDQRAATRDAEAALEIDSSDDTRLLFVSIAMEDRRAWSDSIRVARELFAEQPDSVTRLNALGYALIQQPQGLEEGYRLLWRGFNFGPTDYAVIDSLGWAYYLHGAFNEARVLIERANELSQADPNSEVLDHLGDVYWRLDRHDDARDAWREALDARPDALRRESLEQKLARGLTASAPRRRELPDVNLPDGPSGRSDL